MSGSTDDLELTQYLRGDSALSRAYRDTAHTQPPMHLDGTVLRAARGAVGGPRRGRLAWWQPFSRRWTVPAAAASLLLVASVSLLVIEHEDAPEVTRSDGASSDYIQALPPTDTATTGSGARALAPSTTPSSPATHAADDEPAEQDSSAAPAPAPRPAPAPTSPPSAPAVATQRLAPQSGPASPEADRRERELAAIRAQVEASDARAAEAERAAEAARRALLQVEEQRAAFEARRSRVAEERRHLEPLVGADAAAATQGDAPASPQGALFERVRGLLAGGRIEEARTLIEELQATGADVEVPPDIRQALGLP